MARDHRKTFRAEKVAKSSTKTMMSSAPKADSLPANDLIGRKLREFYDEVAKQPVPDRFTALLDALESKSPNKKPS